MIIKSKKFNLYLSYDGYEPKKDILDFNEQFAIILEKKETDVLSTNYVCYPFNFCKYLFLNKFKIFTIRLMYKLKII